MNGNRYFLDTNAIIALLQNAEWIGISVISQLEFLAFSGLSEADIQIFQQFLQRVEVIGLFSQNKLLVDRIIEIRQQYRLKLPDAIIVATARENSAILVTRDIQLSRLTDITVIDW